MTMQNLGDQVQTRCGRYPEAVEESPWGETSFKVKKKTFVFLGVGDTLSLTLKLPLSGASVLENPWAKPAGYGLGKSGWVSLRFTDPADVPLDQLFGWIDESYRAVAQKTLIKRLDADGLGPEPKPAPVIPEDPRCLVVGRDAKRVARAREQLAVKGVGSIHADLDDAEQVAGEASPDVIVVDVHRTASQALVVAENLVGLAYDARVIITGVRDAKMESKIKPWRTSNVEVFRDPPGEVGPVTAVCKALR